MTNPRSILIQAAIKAVHLHGVDGVRMQHIGQIAHTTPSNIYSYFKSKEELLRACYEQIDHEIAHMLNKGIAEVRGDPQAIQADILKNVWKNYWRWLVDHPDETMFFHLYRNWPGFPQYDMVRDISHFEPFTSIIQNFQTQHPAMNSMPPIYLWLHWIDGTVMYAKYVAQGLFSDTPEMEDFVLKLLSSGFKGLVEDKLSSF